VLQRHDDSDEEKRPNKKELRAVDKNLREGQGDYVTKDPYAVKHHNAHAPAHPPRDGKREFDRKSGSVKQAFGNPRPKGGKREDDKEIKRSEKGDKEYQAEDEAEDQEDNTEKEDESTKAISVEDYLRERNLIEEGPADDQQDVNLAKIQQDTGMKVKVKNPGYATATAVKKNNDISNLSRAPQNSIYGSNREPVQAERSDRDGESRGRGGRGGRGSRGSRGGRGGPRREDRDDREPREDREDREDKGEKTEKTEKTQKGEESQQSPAEGEQRERKEYTRGGDRSSPRGGRGTRGGSRGGQGPRPQQPRAPRGGDSNLTADDFPKL